MHGTWTFNILNRGCSMPWEGNRSLKKNRLEPVGSRRTSRDGATGVRSFLFLRTQTHKHAQHMHTEREGTFNATHTFKYHAIAVFPL